MKEESLAIIKLGNRIKESLRLSECNIIDNSFMRKVILLKYDNIEYIFELEYLGRFNIFYYFKYYIFGYPNKLMKYWDMRYKVNGVSYRTNIELNDLYIEMNRIFNSSNNFCFN